MNENAPGSHVNTIPTLRWDFFLLLGGEVIIGNSGYFWVRNLGLLASTAWKPHASLSFVAPMKNLHKSQRKMCEKCGNERNWTYSVRMTCCIHMHHVVPMHGMHICIHIGLVRPVLFLFLITVTKKIEIDLGQIRPGDTPWQMEYRDWPYGPENYRRNVNWPAGHHRQNWPVGPRLSLTCPQAQIHKKICPEA